VAFVNPVGNGLGRDAAILAGLIYGEDFHWQLPSELGYLVRLSALFRKFGDVFLPVASGGDVSA